MSLELVNSWGLPPPIPHMGPSCQRGLPEALLLEESGKKKEPKPKLFGPDIFGWGGGFAREGVGAKKFGMCFETQENQTFWRDILGFCRDTPGCPKTAAKSLRKKGLCSILVP